MKYRGIVFTVIFLLACFGTTQAALIANGDFTIDTDTGLDWLDLGLTDGLSVNQALALMSPGGQLEGWAIANLDQIHQLMTNAGWIGSFDSGNTLNFGFAESFNTQTTNFLFDPWGDLGGLGFVDDPVSDIGNWHLTDDPASDFGDTSFSLDSPVSPDFSEQGTGVFLYRVTAVPIPSALWLFATGLFYMVGVAMRECNKRRQFHW